MTAKMSVTEDRVTRVITVKIEISPGDTSRDLEDYTATWRKKKRPFVPDTATVTLIDGKLISVIVSGFLRLKGGRTGAARDSMIWRTRAYGEQERIESAPKWVQLLAEEAPQGVTSWDYPEVQAP